MSKQNTTVEDSPEYKKLLEQWKEKEYEARRFEEMWNEAKSISEGQREAKEICLDDLTETAKLLQIANELLRKTHYGLVNTYFYKEELEPYIKENDL